MAQVVLESVVKKYPNGFEAVKSIDLAIDDHEFVVLVGPSGCGKTTTLRMVAGLEEVTAGTIRIGERIVNDVAPKDRDIAMVFQNYALYPHMTVYKNLAFALKLRRVPRKEIDERVQWAAKTLGLEDLLKRRPKQLSGGQRQRVAVGRAIVRQPQVFLFDEPLSNLDAKLRVSTRAELKRLQQELQTTTIYVTHDQEEAMTLGDRVVVMNRGVIHQCGTPLEVYRNPVDRFVAGFVGMPPMNFLDGQLHSDDDGIRFKGAGMSVKLVPSHRELLTKHVGQNVSLGLRPEVATLCDATHDGAIPVTVEVVEILGAVMDLYVRTETSESLVCRVNTDQVTVGQQLFIALDAKSLHIFEPNTYGDDPDSPATYGANLTASK
jgi:multiple sugar transport system ATP-binding protein